MLYFEKSQPAPPCLQVEKVKRKGDYKCGDVITRLQDDFKNKCYICEAKEPTTINIEHFKPHRGDIDLKFDWNNLFFSCSRCNTIKGDRYDNLLDCTQKSEDPELRLQIIYDMSARSVQVFIKEDSIKAQNTGALLQAVYNGTTPLQQLNAANLKKAIATEIQDFSRLLQKYLLNRTLSEAATQLVLEKIKIHLNKASHFAGFKRWIVRDSEELFKVFEGYLD